MYTLYWIHVCMQEPTNQSTTPPERKDLSDWDGFIVNSTHTGSLRYRRGGPLADNDPYNKAGGAKKQKIGVSFVMKLPTCLASWASHSRHKSFLQHLYVCMQTCISCESENVKLWHGNRYRCHKGAKIKEHASFCGTCATGYDEEDDPIACPKHNMNPFPQSEAEMIPLKEVYI